MCNVYFFKQNLAVNNCSCLMFLKKCKQTADFSKKIFFDELVKINLVADKKTFRLMYLMLM